MLEDIDLVRDYNGSNGTFSPVRYVFPEISDYEKDNFTWFINEKSLDKSWMQYENGTNFITFYPNFVPPRLVRKSTNVEIPIYIEDFRGANQTAILKVIVK